MASKEFRHNKLRFAPKVEALEDRRLLSFSPASHYAVGGSANRVTTGVFRPGTGITDLAVTTAADKAVVLPGKHDGTFGDRIEYSVAAGSGPVELSTGDLNCNDSLDLAVGNYNTSKISNFFGTGGRRLFPTPINASTAANPGSMAIADFTSDGEPDILTAHYSGSLGNNTVRLLKGNCDTSFELLEPINGGGAWSWDMEVGDFNGDGNLDAAITHYDSSAPRLSIILGNGNGTFKPPTNYSLHDRPTGLAAGDLNGDGILDLAITYFHTDEVGLQLGNGDGTFQPSTNLPVPGDAPREIVIADLGDAPSGNGDADGNNDFAVAMEGTDSIAVCYHLGTFPFFNCVSHSVGDRPFDVAAGDFDRNGLIDLVTANYGSANVSVLLNTATRAPAPNAPPRLDAASIRSLTSLEAPNSDSFVGVGSHHDQLLHPRNYVADIATTMAAGEISLRPLAPSGPFLPKPIHRPDVFADHLDAVDWLGDAI